MTTKTELNAGSEHSASPDRNNKMADPQVPGMKVGARMEFCVIGDIIPGHTDMLRQVLAKQMANERSIQDAVDKIALVHEARFVLLDGGKRLMFCSSYDGDFDPYIDDFAATVVGPNFDEIWNNVEGYPGVRSPGVKDWFKAHAIRADHFVVAYPKPTVKQVWQALAVQEAFEKVLDTPARARHSKTQSSSRSWSWRRTEPTRFYQF